MSIEWYDTEAMEKAMRDLNLTIMSMSEDEVEIFKENNKELIERLVDYLT